MTTIVGADAAPIASPAGGLARPAGRYRWTVVALLFASTTICYIDRQVFGLLKPTLDGELGWSETDYGDIIAVFSLMYALGYLLGGRLMDGIGVRRGLGLAVAGWSISAALHGLMSSVIGFKFARAALGLAEGGNFPASIKTVREWFPARERALATGVFNAGSNIGAIVTPITLPFVVAAFGWRPAFLIAGWVSRSLPQARMPIFALAGAVSLWTAFEVMGVFTPMPTLIAAARTAGGLMAMAATGLVGGTLFAGLTAARSRSIPAQI